jgi:hypothetical protein
VPPKLFDLALENRERITDVHHTVKDIKPKVDQLHTWQHGYDGSPLTDAKACNDLVRQVEDLAHQCRSHHDQLASIQVNSDERSKARNKFWPELNEPNSESDLESRP